jgi:hypothetical protein
MKRRTSHSSSNSNERVEISCRKIEIIGETPDNRVMGQTGLSFNWRGTASIISIAIVGLSSTAMAGCVFPDGVSVNTDYVPCTDSEGSNCCHMNDKCTVNGFCLSVLNGYHYRGGCTDETFESPSCPTQCRDSATGEFRCQFRVLDSIKLVVRC